MSAISSDSPTFLQPSLVLNHEETTNRTTHVLLVSFRLISSQAKIYFPFDGENNTPLLAARSTLNWSRMGSGMRAEGHHVQGGSVSSTETTKRKLSRQLGKVQIIMGKNFVLRSSKKGHKETTKSVRAL